MPAGSLAQTVLCGAWTSHDPQQVHGGHPRRSEIVIEMDHWNMAHHVRAVAADGLHALVAQAGVEMRREPVADPGLAALLGEAGLAAYAVALQGEEELGISAQEPFVIAVKIDADTMLTAQPPTGLRGAVDKSLLKAQTIAQDAMLGHDLLQQPCFIAATVVEPALDGAFDGEMGRLSTPTYFSAEVAR